MADKYSTFNDLVKNTRENTDWRVSYRDRESTILIAAVHGGRTEPHTATIAKAIAGVRHSLYVFEALTSGLHITSDRFTEPRAVAQAHRHHTVLTVHGCCNRRSRSIDVFVGGLDAQLRDAMIAELNAVGFTAAIDRSTPGRVQGNICNAGASHAGVQLEITRRLRNDLGTLVGVDPPIRKFAKAVRRALKTNPN